MEVAWMTSSEFWLTIVKLASVPFLVLLNGFFVAANSLWSKSVTRNSRLLSPQVTDVQRSRGTLGRFRDLGDVLAPNGSELRVEEVTETRITRIKLTRPRQGVRALSRETPAPNAPTDLHQTQRARADLEHSKTVQAA
jgi:hypothetical protein